MKKLLIIIAIAATAFISSCNDYKDPPDGFGVIKARRDSLARVDSIQKLIIVKQ